MLRHERSAPIWLFSFVDLAFLLLIAFTQIGLEPSSQDDALAAIEMPRIHGRGTPLPGSQDAARWQLRVHPSTPPTADTAAGSHAPFVLKQIGSTPGAESEASVPPTLAGVSAEELDAQLRLLHTRRFTKPVLTPHRDARAEDLLVAVAMLEDVWDEGRVVAVRPGPPVAAGPVIRSADEHGAGEARSR